MRTPDAKAPQVDTLRLRADAEAADQVGRDRALLTGEIAIRRTFT